MTTQELYTLAEQFGTPLYLFDARELRMRVDTLKRALRPRAQLCFAVKANPFIIPMVAPLVERLEVCSPGEYRICEACDMDASELVISGVHKDADLMRELAAAPQLPGRFTIESPTQLELLNAVGAELDRRLPVLIRVSSGNQFGIDVEAVESVIAHRRHYRYLDMCGLQLFSGTQKTSARRVVRELERLDALAQHLAHEHGWQARELEYGPGLPVAYFADDAFDEADLLAALRDALDHLQHEGPVVLELGRSIAASCGTYLTRVVDTKCNRGEHYAIVDGGIHHLVYFGQSMAMHQPPCHVLPAAFARSDAKAIAQSPARAANKHWNICGSLCSVNDILVKQLPASHLSPGDLLVFERAGAYCMTEGISLFLSRDLPCVVTIDELGNAELSRAAIPTHPFNTPRVTG